MPVPAKIRYVAKSYTQGRRVLIGIYDTQRGSWPALLRGVLRVPQNFGTGTEAQAWADEHLNAPTPGHPVKRGHL